MDGLEAIVKDKAHNLEASLSQIDDYQKQIQELRKRILQEEQQLRLIMAPTYLPGDREKAASEQQVRFLFFIVKHCHSQVVYISLSLCFTLRAMS